MASQLTCKAKNDITERALLAKRAILSGKSNGGVAQLVEQRNHNPRVGGSKPSAATIPSHILPKQFQKLSLRASPSSESLDDLAGGRLPRVLRDPFLMGSA